MTFLNFKRLQKEKRARVPMDEDILARAVTMKAEGVDWGGIGAAFPDMDGLAYEMGSFCYRWVPDWSPSFKAADPATMRAAVRNYEERAKPVPEWAME